MVLVALGPTAELHLGIHGGLLDHPPPGAHYLVPSHEHRFAAPHGEAALDPFTSPTLSEVASFDLGPPGAGQVTGVHSSRLPVAGGTPWVVDTDDLVLTLAYGRPLARGSHGLPPLDSDVVRQRTRLMAKRYAAAECLAVLFRTEYALGQAASYLEDAQVLAPSTLAALLGKFTVLAPAVPPLTRPEDKPGSGPAIGARRRLRVLYMGRSYADKGGGVAAEVFARVRAEGLGVDCVWIGPCPPQVRAAVPTVEFHDVMPRPQYLQLLAAVDIVLSPTRFESFGAGLLEAQANSAVVVTTVGSGMEHVREVLTEGEDALFVDTGLPDQDQVAAFVGHLRSLAAHPEQLRRMQHRAWARCTGGPRSYAARHALLSALYERFLDWPEDNPEKAGGDGGPWVIRSPVAMHEGYAVRPNDERRRLILGSTGQSHHARSPK